MLKMTLKMLWAFVEWLKYPIFALIGIYLLFLFLVGINIFISFCKGKRFKKGTRRRIKQHNIFTKIFVDLPKRYVADMYEKEPDFFQYQGLIIFEGRQGNGKTISMIEFARRMQEEYPRVLCGSNLNYLKQNFEIDHWRKLVDIKNGIYGIIAIMDELQNWFSSNQSRDFPPEMLKTITQNRKNRRIILGTAQNFHLLAKPIRSQCTEVRRCTTLLGCLTIVRRYEPIIDSEGVVTEYKRRGMYFFVHDKDLRDSYDTYHVIDNLSKSGFYEAKQTVENNTTYIIQEKSKK